MGFLKKVGKLGGKILDPFGLTGMARGGKNPAEAGRGYMERIPGYGREAYEPFIGEGRKAYESLSPEYLKYLKEAPGSVSADIESYEPSGYYQKLLPHLQAAMEGAAIQGGYVGTPYDEERRADMVRSLMGQDIGEYLDRLERRRTFGATGLEAATGRGFHSAGSMADFLGTSDLNRANMEVAGKSQQQANKNAFMGDLIKALSMGFGSFAGAKGFGGAGDEMPQKTGSSLRSIGTRLPPSTFGKFGGSIYGGR